MEANNETANALDLVEGATIAVPLTELDLKRSLGRLMSVSTINFELFVDGKKHDLWQIIRERFGVEKCRAAIINTTILESR